MKKISLLLAEDHTIVRQGLQALLKQSDHIDVIGQAEDGQAAVKKTAEMRPDVVLMDISMPILNGIEATLQIKKQHPATKVLILSMHPNEEYIYAALNAGASGYILKQDAHLDLMAAIEVVAKDEVFLSPSVSTKVVKDYLHKSLELAPSDRLEKLTPRERQILQLIAEGKTNKQIAGLFFISAKTVETHKIHLKEKLGIRTTADLVKYALRKGIISPE
jgi:DNA-binding NarL/FixJ family response regulator